jgi:hypothetical protein
MKNSSARETSLWEHWGGYVISKIRELPQFELRGIFSNDGLHLRIAMPARGIPRQRTLPQMETLEVAHAQLRHRARGQRLGPH